MISIPRVAVLMKLKVVTSERETNDIQHLKQPANHLLLIELLSFINDCQWELL